MEPVTFEIAKKLKEKGFPQGNKEDIRNYYYKISDGLQMAIMTSNGEEVEWYCPNISEVLKWLRDEKKIYLSVTYVPKIDGIPDMFYPKFQKIGNFEFTKFCGCGNYNTYEEAELAGIEYVLDNIL